MRAAEDYILRQETLIRAGALLPVVTERQSHADVLACYDLAIALAGEAETAGPVS